MKHGYAVRPAVHDGVEILHLEQEAGARAAIAPGLGLNCFSFETPIPVLETVDFAEFRKKPTGFGIPILFPFPNRVRDGVFAFRGARFRVDPPRHGFVRDKAWRIMETGASDAEGAWIRSAINASDYPREILDQFPFPFSLEVTYRLREGALELNAVAENTGERTMPAGFGIHPYFRKPGRGTVQIPAEKRWELADSLPTGRRLELDGGYNLRRPIDIDGLLLDDVYTDLEADASGTVSCRLNDDINGIQTVVEFPRAQFPHVVLYTPPAPRAAFCIEPNSCPTDAFNLHARGIDASVIELEPGEKACFHVRISSRELL